MIRYESRLMPTSSCLVSLKISRQAGFHDLPEGLFVGEKLLKYRYFLDFFPKILIEYLSLNPCQSRDFIERDFTHVKENPT